MAADSAEFTRYRPHSADQAYHILLEIRPPTLHTSQFVIHAHHAHLEDDLYPIVKGSFVSSV